MATFDLTSVTDLRPSTNTSGVIADVAMTITTSQQAATAFTGTTVKYVAFECTQPCRIRWDGTAPSSTVGHYIAANKVFLWTVAQWNGSKIILDTTKTADGALIASPLTT